MAPRFFMRVPSRFIFYNPTPAGWPQGGTLFASSGPCLSPSTTLRTGLASWAALLLCPPLAWWHGRAVQPTPEKRRALFEPFENSGQAPRVCPPPVSVNRGGHPEGHATVKMVLATFAETKVARRTGAKPRPQSPNKISGHIPPHQQTCMNNNSVHYSMGWVA